MRSYSTRRRITADIYGEQLFNAGVVPVSIAVPIHLLPNPVPPPPSVPSARSPVVKSITVSSFIGDAGGLPDDLPINFFFFFFPREQSKLQIGFA